MNQFIIINPIFINLTHSTFTFDQNSGRIINKIKIQEIEPEKEFNYLIARAEQIKDSTEI